MHFLKKVKMLTAKGMTLSQESASALFCWPRTWDLALKSRNKDSALTQWENYLVTQSYTWA